MWFLGVVFLGRGTRLPASFSFDILKPLHLLLSHLINSFTMDLSACVESGGSFGPLPYYAHNQYFMFSPLKLSFKLSKNG